jgi:ribulose-phosphate 3-epimerase
MIGDRPIELEVDGGIKPSNIAAAVEAGANAFVAGSAVFSGNDYHATIGALRNAVKEAA